MKNIGIVCEGPTDYILLKGIIDRITGKENYYLQLQPEDNLAGEYGNGWKGVWKWCLEHMQNINSFMKDIDPQLDCLIVQMDGDVARKEKEVHCLCNPGICDQSGRVHPLECEKVKRGECPVELPCENHELNVEGYMAHLTSLILNCLNSCDGLCITIPCDSTDTWVAAAYDIMQNIEMVDDPWMTIISKRKEYHGIRIPGHKKRLVTYRQFVKTVCTQWEQVKELCNSARQFDEGIKKLTEWGA